MAINFSTLTSDVQLTSLQGSKFKFLLCHFRHLFSYSLIRLKNVLWFQIKDFITFYSMQQTLREGFEWQVSISDLIERCTSQTYTDHIFVIQASVSRLIFQHWMTETGCVIKLINSSPGKVHASFRLLRLSTY